MKAPGFEWGKADYARQLQRSSFAAGAWLLEPQARADLRVFYAYCRAIDDCADEFSPAQARIYLGQWSKALGAAFKSRQRKARQGQHPQLLADLAEMCGRRGLPLSLLRELLLGALSDARPRVRFETRSQLELYMRRVAGSVGEACLPLFGLDRKAAKAYADALGLAFQYINVVRDAAEDAGKGRLYFALADLKRHGISPAQALAGQGMQPLLAEYGQRARQALELASRLSQALPRKGLRPSRMMRVVYSDLLDRMEKDGYQVFSKRYRASKRAKLGALISGLLS